VLPEPGFLEGVREACTRAGALLVIDETHTLSGGVGGTLADDALSIAAARTTLGDVLA
jgi:glutamate-1-semialdehyde 2,1-aminomutase